MQQKQEICNLKYYRKTYDQFVGSFKSYKLLKNYAVKIKDIELIGVCRTIEKYGEETSNLVDRILSKSMCDNRIILTTVHKAKGLEWNNVYLCEDFIKLTTKKSKLRYINKKYHEEINILYVALTRAKSNLKLNSRNPLVDFIPLYLNH